MSTQSTTVTLNQSNIAELRAGVKTPKLVGIGAIAEPAKAQASVVAQ